MLLLSGQFGTAGAVTLVCISSMYLVPCSRWLLGFVQPLDIVFTPVPPFPIYFSLLISHCNRCLVLLMCRLMAGKNSVSKGASTWKGLTKFLDLNQEIAVE